MSFRRRQPTLVMSSGAVRLRLGAGATAVVLALGAGPQLGAMAHTGSAFRPTEMGDAVLAAAQTPAATGTSSSGNLQVFVPPAPSRESLRTLCTTFLHPRPHERRSTVTGIHLLVSATGESPTRTAVWCHRYLARH
jgi:hypothetical protein